ncbi:oligogalacturonate-specific porin KdgM family protein [Brenneria tiliae]|uniref:Oligogalacturonate-specific porin KdgM family protein n=1 Tax=Brenneria tiliae TaxID=2914984 RepID=A0ABT0MYY7_9GAMM|nr:oligogalacturonate-specific porin KdgM family protein [Brenneria tiliae]MCL2895053.1 oligogalacturonate-specific porin KdgM family protein [Brenneria tiliae]
MKLKLLALAATSLISVGTMATTIDYRHDMTDAGGNTHKDRLAISHWFANGFGIYTDIKWKGGENKNKPYNEQVSNGTEVVASYVHEMGTWFIEPGFSLESDSNSNNYRPYVRVAVKITEDWSYSFRYRPYYKRTSTTPQSQERGYNLTGVLTYKYLDWQIDYEMDYKKATKAGVLLADNENWKIEHDVKVSYKWDKNWKPYIQVANIAGASDSDERNTRFRAGIQYSF